MIKGSWSKLKKLNELFNDTEKKKLKPLIILSGICIVALLVMTFMPDKVEKETSAQRDTKTQETSRK